MNTNNTIRLALDTCAVRAHVHQDAERPDLTLLAGQKGVLVSISDVASAELLIALLENRIPWDAWTKRIQELSTVLDPELPILPGGRQLAEMAGLVPSVGASVDDAKAHSRALWRLLASATSPDDLKRGTTYTDSRGTQGIKADLPTAQQVITDERQGWIKFIDKMKSFVTQGGWSLNKVQAIVTAGLQPQAGESSDLAAKLDALSRFLSGRIHQAAEPHEPYDPAGKKRKNDGIDLSLLYALAFPAVICTTDQWFINRVRESGSPQATQIVTVVELNELLRKGTIGTALPGTTTTAP